MGRESNARRPAGKPRSKSKAPSFGRAQQASGLTKERYEADRRCRDNDDGHCSDDDGAGLGE